jgi:hypothetical protein
MGEHACYLITILYDNGYDQLIRCALKTEFEPYPMEPDARLRLHGKLPLHIRSCGPIVHVEEIFGIHDSTIMGCKCETTTLPDVSTTTYCG